MRRINTGLGAKVRVLIDASFTDNDTLEVLEDRNIEYLGRLPPGKIPALNRKRGSADAHMGELESSLDVHLGFVCAPAQRTAAAMAPGR